MSLSVDHVARENTFPQEGSFRRTGCAAWLWSILEQGACITYDRNVPFTAVTRCTAGQRSAGQWSQDKHSRSVWPLVSAKECLSWSWYGRTHTPPSLKTPFFALKIKFKADVQSMIDRPRQAFLEKQDQAKLVLNQMAFSYISIHILFLLLFIYS